MCNSSDNINNRNKVLMSLRIDHSIVSSSYGSGFHVKQAMLNRPWTGNSNGNQINGVTPDSMVTARLCVAKQ